MAFRTDKKGREEAMVAVLDVRFDPATGKGELSPGPFYSSMNVKVGDIEQMRAEAIQQGYDKLTKWMMDYREHALSMGYVVATPTFIG